MTPDPHPPALPTIRCRTCHGTKLMRQGQGSFFCAQCGAEVLSTNEMKRVDFHSYTRFNQALTQLVPAIAMPTRDTYAALASQLRALGQTGLAEACEICGDGEAKDLP